MSQTYSIELYFDPSLENQILKAYNILARRQITTQLIEIESRPHITLFTSAFIDPSKLEPILNSFVSKHDPIPLTFSSIGFFSGYNNNNNIHFLSPTPTFALLEFQSQLCEVLKKEGVEIGEDFRVDSWVPVCPVAQDVPKSRLSETVNVLRELKLPVSGYGMDVGVVEFSPVRELCSFMLGNSVDG